MLYFLPFLGCEAQASYKDTKCCSCTLCKFLGVFRPLKSCFFFLAMSDGVELGKILKICVFRNPKCLNISKLLPLQKVFAQPMRLKAFEVLFWPLHHLMELNWAKSTKFLSLVTQSARVILLILSILSYFAQPM